MLCAFLGRDKKMRPSRLQKPLLLPGQVFLANWLLNLSHGPATNASSEMQFYFLF
jgi:hypothetical protein